MCEINYIGQGVQGIDVCVNLQGGMCDVKLFQVEACVVWGMCVICRQGRVK
jgi:hypothetical protein